MAARTENSVIIEAPMDLVWSRTNDVAGWADLFTEYAKADVLAKEGNRVQFQLTMHPDEQGRVWAWVSERTADPTNRVVLAHRQGPGPFRFMHIRWTYDEVDAGVMMRWIQEFEMRPEAPVDDAAMAERINANTPVQMKVIKAKLEAEAAAQADRPDQHGDDAATPARSAWT